MEVYYTVFDFNNNKLRRHVVNLKTIKFLLGFAFLLPNILMGQWQVQNSGTDKFLTGLFFLDNQHGWVVFQDSSLLTSNGGLTWEKVNVVTSGSDPLFDVAFRNSDRGLATSEDGLVYRTVDGGFTWKDINTQSDNINYFGISYIGFEAWIIGSSETIAYSPNSGSTWSVQHSGSSDLNEVYFVDRNLGWAVGDNGTILHTQNAGQMNGWTDQERNNYPDLFGVWFTSSQIGWAVGENGTILKTANAGQLWIEQNSITGNTLEQLSFSDNLNGVIVGLNGVILHTIDGGITWEDESGIVNTILSDVHYIDLENCWAIGENGTILYSLGSVSISSPSGGQRFEEGTDQEITWESSYTQNVRIDLSTNNGGSWDYVVKDQTSAPVGSYSNWTVSNTPSNQCKIRVQSLKDSQVESISPPFEIYKKSLTIKKPTSTDTLIGGEEYTIEWSHSKVEKVNLRLQVEQNPNYAEIANNISASDLMYKWIVDKDINSYNCYIWIFENDGDGPESVSEKFTIKHDSEKPSIVVNTSRLNPVKGQDLIITATITDDNPTINTLYYREGGESNYLSQSMALVESDQYQATVPDQESDFAIDERGFLFYIKSIDTSSDSNVSYFPSEGENNPQYLLVSLSDMSYDILSSNPQNGAAGEIYQLITIPYKLDDTRINSVLADEFGSYDTHKWRLWFWRNDNDGYGEFTKDNIGEFTQGKSFWLATINDKFTSDAGQSYAPENFTISLQPGYNQFGHPFAFPVFVEDIFDATADTSGISTIWSYNNKWEAASILEPGRGYFVKNMDDVNMGLTIPPRAASGSYNSISKWNFPNDGWKIKLKCRADCFADEYNLIGISKTASINWDNLDQPEPPPVIGKYISLYFPHKEWQTYPDNYTTDFRPFDNNGEIWDFVIETNVENSVAKVIFDGIELVPHSLQVYLIDEKFRITQDIRENNMYVFPTANGKCKKQLKLAIGKSDFFEYNNLLINMIPSDYELKQNFPNPFNMTTAILYSLPKNGSVTLTIYNVMGEEITVLLSKEQKNEGAHMQIWDGLDKYGAEVTSGIYFCQMTAGSFCDTKKMLLNK